jgi:hypothetical protein
VPITRSNRSVSADSDYSSQWCFEQDCLSPTHYCYCLLHPTHHQLLRCYPIPPLTVTSQNQSLRPMQYPHPHLLETSPNRRRRRHQQQHRVYPRWCLPTQRD